MTSTLPRFCMVGFVTLVGVGCAASGSKGGDSAPAPLSTADCPRGRPPTTAAEFQGCVQKQHLKFDTTSAVGDEQPLMVIDPDGTPCPGNESRRCRYGPLAKIEPEEHAHSWNSTEMADGRIIARIYLLPGAREGYPKFGLVRDARTYWWVQHDGKSGRSVYVTIRPNRESADTVSRELEVYGYTDRSTIRQAIARWIWDPMDEKTQGSCGSSGSCR
jgi:hypothetical protein